MALPWSVPATTRVAAFLMMAALAEASSLAAQTPAADSTRGDTTSIILPEITVSVTRSREPLERVPAAVGGISRDALRRGQATLGLDEAFNNLPGLYVANRYNYSLDQRLSIRGFGSRSSFGTRGVKILVDGVPQTLPDGQSQLTNVDLASIDRVEVLRGSASSLYGNASGGVISLTTEAAAPGPFAQTLRAEGGSDGLLKVQGLTSARRGDLSATLSASHTVWDGFRAQSAAELTQVNLGLEYRAADATSASLRFGYGDQPKAENPGALTFAEYAANPDSTTINNILRKADKNVDQEQLALTIRHTGRPGEEYSATIFGVLRNLKNPLAAVPTGVTAGPTIGTFVDIDRQVIGLRLGGSRQLGEAPTAPALSYGVDLQRMRDRRKNFRAVAGVPDTLVLDQIERVTEFGPFAQATWSPRSEWLISGGGRYDAVVFDVTDQHFSDGADNSGKRTMQAASGNVGVSYTRSERAIPYLTVSTSFETPTTTELANQPNSTGGFNSGLDPQRAVNYEIGVRGRVGATVEYSAAGFLSRITDAIIQFREVSGRAFFTNAGKLHNDGLELGLQVTPIPALTVFGSYTYAHYRFRDYKILNAQAGTVDTLDGNKLSGVPDHFGRLGIRSRLPGNFSLDVDHTMSSSLYADDLNTLLVGGWSDGGSTYPKGIGSGVTNARITWSGVWGGSRVTPYLGVNNLQDRKYVGSVNINGFGGRVYEPAPRRTMYLGAEVGWAAH